MAFGGSRFGAGSFAGSEKSTSTRPGGGYILDRPQYGGYTEDRLATNTGGFTTLRTADNGTVSDRPTATTGYASDRPRTGGHISDRGATP